MHAAARVLDVDALLADERDYATLAGMVIEELGHIPEPGEHITRHGWCFEVVDLDGRRIDKLLVRRPEPQESGPM